MRFWNVIDTGVPGDALGVLGAPSRGRCRDDGGPFELGGSGCVPDSSDFYKAQPKPPLEE